MIEYYTFGSLLKLFPALYTFGRFPLWTLSTFPGFSEKAGVISCVSIHLFLWAFWDIKFNKMLDGNVKMRIWFL